MSPQGEKISSKVYDLLALSIERIIGYTFSGILLLFLFVYNSENPELYIREIAGRTTLTIIACLVIGLGSYTIYFRLLGNFLLFPIQHLLHGLKDIVFNERGDNHTSTIFLLHHYGVNILRCRDAYEAVKDHIFSGDNAISVQLAHGELHVLYLMSVTAFLQVYIDFLRFRTVGVAYYATAAFLYFCAVLGDTAQHSKEAFRIKAHRASVINFLLEEGFIPSSSELRNDKQFGAEKAIPDAGPEPHGF